MGGILAAEVALLPPFSKTDRDTFRHRILGTVNFDTPFLGMHPGVIVSGISSLFKAKPVSPTLEPQHEHSQLSQQVSEQSLGSGYFPTQSQSSTVHTGTTPHSVFSPFATPMNDPNYDPPFTNDVRLPVRKGWDSTLHFIMKHSDGLTKATKSYVTSHLEFGGCLADYRGLKSRYEKIRALEDVDDSSPISIQIYRPATRIRFVNYYTASTGRTPTPKQPATLAEQHLRSHVDGARSNIEQEMQDMSLTGAASSRSASRSPRISIADPEGVVVAEILADEDGGAGPEVDTHSDGNREMNSVSPSPYTDDEGISGDGANDTKSSKVSSVSTHDATPDTQRSSVASSAISLPPLPPTPIPPPPFDPTPYADKDALKLAEKEYNRRTKLYKQALKNRDTAIKDRRKLLEKREKAARQAREKALKGEEKERLKREKEDAKKGALKPQLSSPELKELRHVDAEPVPHSTSPSLDRSSPANIDGTSMERQFSDSTTIPPPAHHSSLVLISATSSAPTTSTKNSSDPDANTKPKKDRKFCMTPPKINGQRDPCWPRIYMEGVDEVGAHCGLFVAGKPHYAALVQDVGDRIVGWVNEKGRHIGRGGG
jgi:hypothetical protein